MKISEVLKTGVMSGWFNPVNVSPVPREASLGLWYDFRSRHQSRSRRDSSASSQSYASGRSLKDALMGWNDKARSTFDPAIMENVYKDVNPTSPATDSDRDQNVLCTVEFGLVCIRRDSNGTDANGSKSPQHEDRKGEESMSCTWLVKPKVLLESVRDIL
ncbi:hypothetical protein GLOTRDRAFT_111590 [Gloeophyllum trabeum ATCC 11539]|uniref:Uncharacterized protein n=1 Tax=Gloeophyllum trabeum (strain ATCC 11539 / FP-39264 / Madison 617) TaxID=670483 RepID=S7Q2L1_GLOTA|nr:uncharacterized protein GLOTRDRAFT_111590 [Gloeophyllum trabeum ATCC 11539]EPQ54231.1 hypothetical protein GLOTRDRAFT_111590 [Gloeophyllum trabeum ATCC 11539]